MPKFSQKRRPTIDSLISRFPFQIKHPELLGLRLKEGATMAIVVETSDKEQFSVGLKFSWSDQEHTIFFNGPVHQSWLRALSSPGCIVSLDLDGDEINTNIWGDQLHLDSMTSFSTLAGFLEEFDDSQPDEERFEGCAEQ